MSNARSKQLRLEKKRRRRTSRQGRNTDGGGPAVEVKYAARMVVSSDGRQPDPGLLPESFSTLMSDTLVELMDPYIQWPPPNDGFEDLQEWLHLGADVWNVIVTATDGAACAYGLKQLAQGLADEDALGLVMEIAQRKFTHFAQDWRRVSSVRVVAKAGWATVEATTFQQVRGASR